MAEDEGWTEPDGTKYVPNKDGGYDVIPPSKAKKSRAKKSDKSANSKKGN